VSDDGVRLKTCPVLLFTPEVEDLQRWFEWTHDVRDGFYHRSALPGPGSLGEQDAYLMQALDCLRDVSNTVLAEAQRERQQRRAQQQGRRRG